MEFQQTGLFYDTTKGCYLQYNQFTGAYEPVHATKKRCRWSKKRYKRKAIEKFGNRAVERMDQDNVDVMECVYDLVDRVSFLAGDDEETIRRHGNKYGASNIRYDDELDNWMVSRVSVAIDTDTNVHISIEFNTKFTFPGPYSFKASEC